MMVSMAAAAVLAAFVAACTPAPPAGEGPGSTAADTARVVVEGTVAVAAGPAGRGIPTLVPDGGRAMALSGPLTEELGQVDGARVRVVGTRTDGPAPGGGFEATEYELLAVDGERPEVGVVRMSGGVAVLALRDGTTVRLMGAPAELASRVGAKAWVVGRRDGGGIAVQRYGFLRAP
jgi:hypothetical protein